MASRCIPLILCASAICLLLVFPGWRVPLFRSPPPSSIRSAASEALSVADGVEDQSERGQGERMREKEGARNEQGSNARLGGCDVPQTMNIITGEMYPHHPVMAQVPLHAYTLENDYIIEVNGLKVPARFDCNNFHPHNVNNGHWGAFPYFFEVPSRWYACYMHEAAVRSGLLREVPSLPYVDDEYNEQVAVYQSVLRASRQQTYVVAELGARWGTWGSRAIAFLRKVRPEASYNLYLVEPVPAHCEGIKEVMSKNGFTYTLACEKATDRGVRQWAATVDHIDLIDFDIQRAEHQVVPSLMDLLNAKAYRLIIATHEHFIHKEMQDLFRKHGWILIWDVRMQGNPGCVTKYLRGYYSKSNKDRFHWRGILKERCYHNTSRGPVAHMDGELIVDNPRFVDRSRVFSLSDKDLRIGELLV